MAKYDGLIYIPASDQNFISGIQGLTDLQLGKMLEKLYELNESEQGHKGRIKAVEKEITNRNGTSTEAVAMDKKRADIELVERLYGDGMPYELDRIENETKFYLAQTAQSLFEAGKRFLRIQTHEKHGDFLTSLERIGVPVRTAYYAIAAVKKFDSNLPALANLGSAKIKMLTIFNETDIKEYAEGGPLGNIPHDDVETMTTRELREAIREERKKSERTSSVLEKKLQQKNEQITKLEMENANRQPPTKEQLAGIELDEHMKPFNVQLQDAIFAMGRCIDMITEIQRIDNIGFVQLNDWILKQSSDIEAFTLAFQELQDTINDIHIDNGEDDKKKKR